MAWLRIGCLFLLGCGLIFAVSFSVSSPSRSTSRPTAGGGGIGGGGGGGGFGGGGAGAYGRLEVVRVDSPVSSEAELKNQLAVEEQLQNKLVEIERENALAKIEFQEAIAGLESQKMQSERAFAEFERQNANARKEGHDSLGETERQKISAEIERQQELAKQGLQDAFAEMERRNANGEAERQKALIDLDRHRAELEILRSRKTEPKFKLLPSYYAPLPEPPADEAQLIVVHQFGAARGFYAAAEFLSEETNAPFTDFLAINNIEPNLQPAHMSRGNTSADWGRVGVVSGVFQCLDSAQFLTEGLDNLDQKKLRIEEAILTHAVGSCDEFCDPIVRAQLLNSLEVRWKKINAAATDNIRPETTQSLSLIPSKIGSATDQTTVTAWWDKIWSSSIFATIGGVLLAMLGIVIEKKIQGPVQLAVVRPNGNATKPRPIPNSKQKPQRVD